MEPTRDSSMSANDGRNVLADELKREGFIRTESVESAFRTVPRHLFVPEVDPDQAYQDEVIPIESAGGGADSAVASSASQPAIVATMLEQLELSSGHRVLEVGAGSGYNAALMAHMVGEEGLVITVEIDEALARRARESLATAGLETTESGWVEVVHGDGGAGYPDEAPYDRIIVTAGAPDIAPAWREQLRADGRLVLPLEIWRGLQVCTAFEPTGKHLTSVAAQWCGFVPLRGALAEASLEEPEVEAAIEPSLQKRLCGLREASLASGLFFPEALRIKAYPRESGYVPSSEELVVEKRGSRLVLDWR